MTGLFYCESVCVEWKDSCAVMSWVQTTPFTPAHCLFSRTDTDSQTLLYQSATCMPLWVVGSIGGQTSMLQKAHTHTQKHINTQFIEDLMSSNMLRQDCGVFSFTSFHDICFAHWEMLSELQQNILCCWDETEYTWCFQRTQKNRNERCKMNKLMCQYIQCQE